MEYGINSEERKNRRKEAGLAVEAHKNLDIPSNVVVIGTTVQGSIFWIF